MRITIVKEATIEVIAEGINISVGVMVPIIAVEGETFSRPDVGNFKFIDEIVNISVGAIEKT